jgi:hypothetical protein
VKLKLVVSGGQTGADRTGLECAKALGISTGGVAPKGFRTENGSDLFLKDFGLVEDELPTYPPRTRKNVKNSEVTLWFGNTNSPGYWCTKKAAKDYNRPFKENPTQAEVRELAEAYEVWNVAGNRASTNPGVIDLVRTAFGALE